MLTEQIPAPSGNRDYPAPSGNRDYPGLIVRSQSGFFTVQTESGMLTCHLRGRLKQGKHVGDIAAVGDRVQITRQPDGTGSIESVEPRRSSLVRLDPRPQGVYQQVILANPDQAVFVFACASPTPRLRMLDRFLVIAEKQGLPAVIVANKIDLVGREQAEKMFGFYPPIGYPVIYACATPALPEGHRDGVPFGDDMAGGARETGQGVEELRERLTGKVSALAGPSGVGKSSLLNAIQPGLGLAVREISEAFHKGRHTTTVRQLFPLEGGGYVADTPGMRSLALWDTEPEELDGYFPELAPLVAACQFNDCNHKTEPGCAVRAAVEAGRVHPQRYDSYLRLRAGEK
ncbi:MAG: ribosome small subunit-dependent GTPase A [Chloroflexi bacterium]|nr:ribosome small subunit-dependent GTPase A [Chloroflexota bacterium]